MILFFRTPSKSVIATEIDHKPSQDEINELDRKSTRLNSSHM